MSIEEAKNSETTWILKEDQNCYFCSNCKYGFGTGFKTVIKKFKFCPYCGKKITNDIDEKGVAYAVFDDWITDDLPKEHDTYLVTWTGNLGSLKSNNWVSLLEYFPTRSGGEWETYEFEKMGYTNIKILAWKTVEPYDPEKGV